MAKATKESDFYLACLQGNVSRVTRWLEKGNIVDINRAETEGNTLLHAAAVSGNEKVVQLLLEAGANCDLRNNDGRTPAEEALLPTIREILSGQSISAPRLVCQNVAIEWTAVGHEEIEATMLNYKYYMQAGDVSTIASLILSDKEFQKASWFSQISPYFEAAKEDNDAVHLVKAYTIECTTKDGSQFYSDLNRNLAKDCLRWSDESKTPPSIWHRLFAAQIAKDKSLKKYKTWTGETYRGMLISQSDLDAYQKNVVVVNKGFLSTSRKREIAEGFLKDQKLTDPKIGDRNIRCLCIYKIKWPLKAMDLIEISKYREKELEVLIVPHKSAFRVKKVIEDKKANSAEIVLERYMLNNIFAS